MKTTETNQAVPDIAPIESKKYTAIPINQYGMDGKFIRRYNSQREAILELNIKGGSLAKALKGHAKSCKGYQWRYA
jgi:hypothetical protein